MTKGGIVIYVHVYRKSDVTLTDILSLTNAGLSSHQDTPVQVESPEICIRN